MSVAFRRFRRVLAMVCAFAMFFTSVCITSVSLSAADVTTPHITHNDQRVSQVTLLQDGKLHLFAVADSENAGYAWQIQNPANQEQWVTITGCNRQDIWVTYALVGSMLQSDGSAALRCRLTDGDRITYTDPVKVTVSFMPLDSILQPETIEIANPAQKLRLAAPRASEGEEEFKTHSIIINYVFDNNALAFEPYGATVPHGYSFTGDDIITVPSPVVVGYKPVRRIGENYVDASEVVLDFQNIQEDIIINVVYEPTLVNFSVHHHLQNLYDDEYSLHYDYITKSQAITGTMVGEGLALTEAALPGFRALAYEKLTVAADGSTVIEIRYDRNYYLIDFDMNGGYGTEPVYTRYGATVGANVPIRHGYVFAGWELVSYNGRTPTPEEASQYTISASTTIEVPAANLQYRARWITQQTTYTMVFWKENAENNGYSYWGYLEGLGAMSGSIVDAQDWADRAPDIDDADYFTFNPLKSDKNVLVEGDGSTVVNVYYTRNYYTITFKANALCTIPTGHTHGDACYDMICGREPHIHSADCGYDLLCQIPEHTAHTAECIECGFTEHIHGSADCACQIPEHTHTVGCWQRVGDRASPVGAPRNPKNGQVYRRSSKYYYIYLLGSWYNYSAQGESNNTIVLPSCGYNTEHKHGVNCSCDKAAHTHTEECYRDSLHAHTEECYHYTCGLEAHSHDTACKRLLCAIPAGHNHNGDCTSNRKSSVIKTVRRKYKQSIGDLWPVVDDAGKAYNSGERWSPTDSTYYKNVLVYLSEMPPDDFTLTLSTADYDTYVMNYYLQVLPGDPYDVTIDSKNYALNHTVVANYNYLTYDEDFFEITGFVRYKSSEKFSNNQIDLPGGGTVNFYYDRGTDNPLTFNNNGIILDDKTVPKNMYQIPLKEFYFEPGYPDNLEPGAYTFKGWYTSPGCFAGTEVDWDTLRMEDGGLQLYAKWSPITHQVRVFKDASLTEQIGQTQIVDHKAFAHAPDGNVVNGNYVFQGWFYKDEVNGELVEKAFVFTGIPVLDDLDIYAKWSSHISVEYRIEYKLHGTDQDIAAPTTGTAIAGNNKTFPAKAGAELYAGYQTGYYPLVSSHTITMSADGNHTFTFYYVYVETMPYKVRYVDSATGAERLPSKKVMDNNLSIVTETFVRIDGNMPDAYQKRLVLVADGTDADGDGILDENTITFYYNSDNEHAYYRVVHYVQNMNGDGYREYRSQEAVGDIGTAYNFDALTLTGFTFDGSLTRVNGIVQPTTGDRVTATLGGSGLLIELFYQRNVVPYTVRYLDRATGEEIYPSKTGSGVFGQLIAEYALDLSVLGYELVGEEEARTLTLSANTDYNVLEFVYQERTVSLKYQLVGPAGCGSLSQTSQNVPAISGVANGSVPTAAEGFLFMGWYLDAGCTAPVPESWVDSATNRLTPVKLGSVWQDATYYAKIIALETDLTIGVQGADARDEYQTFLFRIVGTSAETAGVDLTVAVTGNNSVTITKLPTGQYTVTELTSWAWRYDTAESVKNLNLEYNENGTTIIFETTRENGKWLDGNAINTNLFTKGE